MERYFVFTVRIDDYRRDASCSLVGTEHMRRVDVVRFAQIVNIVVAEYVVAKLDFPQTSVKINSRRKKQSK